MPLVTIDRRRRSGEAGYLLLMLMFFVAMIMLGLATAVPKITTQIRRDREIEMVHRGEQYARAIQHYYKKFGRYPGKIEDLENTNNIRFLRRRYKDPMTPSGAWRLVRFGDIQLGGIAAPVNGAANTGNTGGSTFGQSVFGNSSGGNGQQQGGTGGTAEGDQGGQTTGGTTAPSSGSLFGQQIQGGGGAVIGVASTSSAAGVHEFNKKSIYKEWFFVYDQSQDRGQLIRGPYNPNAFVGSVGMQNSPTGGPMNPAGQGSPGQGPPGTPPQQPQGSGDTPH